MTFAQLIDKFSCLSTEERNYEQCYENQRKPTGESIHSCVSQLLFPLEEGVEIRKHPVYLPVYIHSHNFLEIVYVAKGSAIHNIQNKSFVMKEGSFLLLSPGIYHSIAVFDRSIVINILVASSLFPDILSRTGSSDSPLFAPLRHPSAVLVERQRSADTENLIAMEAGVQGKANALQLRTNLLSSLLLELALDPHATIQSIEDESKDRKLDVMMEYIRSNLKEVTLSSLADYFGYSVPYASFFLHTYAGESYQKIIRHIRLEKAVDLLTRSTLSCREIARSIGFSSIEHFSRSFKEWTGSTPMEYRKQVQSR
jgi:AraC family cel operon transcriptional repressor